MLSSSLHLSTIIPERAVVVEMMARIDLEVCYVWRLEQYIGFSYGCFIYLRDFQFDLCFRFTYYAASF